MPIGEFDGAATLPADNGVFSTPMYWLYEMGHAALDPSRAHCRRHASCSSKTRPIRSPHHLRQVGGRGGRTVRALDATLRQAGMAHRFNRRRRRARAGAYQDRVGAPVLPAVAFRARVQARAAPAAAETADRRADVGPLRDAAARHGRSLPAQSRRLHHRLARRPHGAGGGRPLRSRRLYRLRHLHPAPPRRRHACDRGVPAVGAGAGRGRADGSRQRPLRAAFHGADGRADRHAHQSNAVNKLAEERGLDWFRTPCHHQGAVPASRLHARCLSGLPAAARLRQHESRPPSRGAPQSVHPSGQGRRRFGATSTANSTTNISRSWI